jgi:hypothetical protein
LTRLPLGRAWRLAVLAALARLRLIAARLRLVTLALVTLALVTLALCALARGLPLSLTFALTALGGRPVLTLRALGLALVLALRALLGFALVLALTLRALLGLALVLALLRLAGPRRRCASLRRRTGAWLAAASLRHGLRRRRGDARQ